MKKVFADRIRLLSAIRVAACEMESICPTNDVANIRNALTLILSNTDDYLSISQKDNNSVAYSKEVKDKYEESRRVKTTLGRYVRRRLEMNASKISDEALDKLSAIVKKILSEKDLDKQVTIVKGADIITAYRNAKAGSCMTGRECEKVEIYALNPDCVSLVLHESARAILWKTDEGDIVLDRVYPAQCHSVEIIRRWAELKGYTLRDNADRVVDTGYKAKVSSGKTLSVTLKHRDIFPYMDTFVYGKYSTKTIVAKNDPKFGNMILHNIHGKYERAKVCTNCESRVNSGEYSSAGNGDIYCFTCFDKMFFCCDYCGEHKTIVENNRQVLLSGHYLCENCMVHTTKCKHCNKSDFHTNMALVEDNHYCYDCYVETLFGCTKCNTRFPKENFVIEGVCKNCFEYEECGHCKATIKKDSVFIENGEIICAACGSE